MQLTSPKRRAIASSMKACPMIEMPAIMNPMNQAPGIVSGANRIRMIVCAVQNPEAYLTCEESGGG